MSWAIETSLRERQGDLEVHDRRVKRLEAWRDGGDRVLGAEATLGLAGRRRQPAQERRSISEPKIGGPWTSSSRLSAHAQSLPTARVARCERHAQDALTKAQAASEESDRRFAQQRETLEGIQKGAEAFLTSSAPGGRITR